MNDLDFIRRHVKEWPEGASTVQLYFDGEIGFTTSYGNGRYDFYPDDDHTRVDERDNRTDYTYEQWLGESVAHTAESSAVKLRKCHNLMCENMVEGNVGTYCGCQSAITDNIDSTIAERGNRYGRFADGSVIMQDLKDVMRATEGWQRLTPSQREALEMIQHKIGRILNGDPTYDDNWRDIAGYATLILNELNGVKR